MKQNFGLDLKFFSLFQMRKRNAPWVHYQQPSMPILIRQGKITAPIMMRQREKKRRKKSTLSILRKRLREENAAKQIDILKIISAYYCQNVSEKTCDLNSTNLCCLYDNFLDGSHGVSKLILSRNRIGSLPEIFGNVQKDLEILEINDNKLETFPQSVRHMKRLRDLVAQRNRIRSLPSEFSFLHNLVSLNLSENSLSSIAHLKGLKFLEKLILKKNKISSISDRAVLASWISLRHLDLDGNELTEIPSQIEALAKTLLVLNCSHNRIRTLPSNIGSMVYLKRLNLRFNSVESLPIISISKCTNLSKFLLHGNETTLKEPPFDVCIRGIGYALEWHNKNNPTIKV